MQNISYYHKFKEDQSDDIIELKSLEDELEFVVEEYENNVVIITGREDRIEEAFIRLGYGGI